MRGKVAKLLKKAAIEDSKETKDDKERAVEIKRRYKDYKKGYNLQNKEVRTTINKELKSYLGVKNDRNKD